MNVISVLKFSIGFRVLFIGFLLLIYSSCIDRSVLPPSIGSIGQVTVLVDEYTWDSPVRDSFIYLYESPYLLLPAPEPIFDVNTYPYEEFVAARRQLRYVIFLGDLSVRSTTNDQIRLALGEENYNRAKNDPTYYSAISKDRWATGQTVYYIFGNNREELIQNIQRSFPIISRQIMDNDLSKIRARAYLLGTNNTLTQKVTEKFNIRLSVPGGYMQAMEEDNVLWLRKRAGNTTFGIFVYEEPYIDQEQLSSNHLKSIRDTLGKRYVQSEMPGAYMQVNDIDLPVIYTITSIGEAYAIEARGIWEMEGDFFGGPFISYLVHDEPNGRLIFLDGFVLAPGIDKRVLMQELEYIISNISLL
jgi:hypothetical protein